MLNLFFFFSSRRRHTRSKRDWSSDVCSSDLAEQRAFADARGAQAIEQARTTNAAIAGDTSRSSLQRLEAERDTWAQVLATERLSTTQRLEVQRDFNAASAAAEKARVAQAQAIVRSDLET